MIGKRKHIRQLINGGTSKDPKFLASCYGKIRHDKEDAFERAKEIITMKAYKCKYCNYYHVGRI